jgi:hypothetical protein
VDETSKENQKEENQKEENQKEENQKEENQKEGKKPVEAEAVDDANPLVATDVALEPGQEEASNTQSQTNEQTTEQPSSQLSQPSQDIEAGNELFKKMMQAIADYVKTVATSTGTSGAQNPYAGVGNVAQVMAQSQNASAPQKE